MPEERAPYVGEGEDVVVGGQRPPNAQDAIVITSISNPRWTKDGLHVYADLTDQHGTTRTFAWVPEIANQLIIALSSGINGCHRVSRVGG